LPEVVEEEATMRVLLPAVELLVDPPVDRAARKARVVRMIPEQPIVDIYKAVLVPVEVEVVDPMAAAVAMYGVVVEEDLDMSQEADQLQRAVAQLRAIAAILIEALPAAVRQLAEQEKAQHQHV
jgi:hypothetical protein